MRLGWTLVENHFTIHQASWQTKRPEMSRTQYPPLYHLRALPDGSLYDLLAANPGTHQQTVGGLLRERGVSPDTIERETARRRSDKQPRSCSMARRSRILMLLFSLIIAWFNAGQLFQLYHSDSPYKTFLVVFVLMTIAFGLYLGLKFNMHLYLGDARRVYCGFPVPVGFVDTASGKEMLPPKPKFFLSLLANGLVSVNFTLFIPMLTVYLLG